MRILPIVKEPNKILREEANEVRTDKIQTPEIQQLISDMKKTLQSAPDGVGLAAPQVGAPLKIFIVSEEAEEIDIVGKETQNKNFEMNKPEEEATPKEKSYAKRDWKYYVFINPIVKKLSRRKKEGAEGCLSVPGKYGLVSRHQQITVEALNEKGEKFTRGAANFFARVMQHELDHLEGVLFIDKVKDILKK